MVAPMVAAAGISALGSLAGGLLQSRAAKKAARAQLAAQQQQMAFIREGQDKANTLLSPAANYQPALDKLMALNGLGGPQSQEEAYNNFRTTPGYQFQMDQGITAANRSAAARGTALSGRTLVDLQKQGQGLADQEFGNYYNRLNGLFGQQLGAAGQVASGYTGTANSLANIAGNMGDSRANGIVGQSNSWSNALQGVAGATSYGLGAWDAQRQNKNRSIYDV